MSFIYGLSTVILCCLFLISVVVPTQETDPPVSIEVGGKEAGRQDETNYPVTRRLNPTTRFDNLFTSSDVFKYVRLNNETLKH